jgi:hypothetical protein
MIVAITAAKREGAQSCSVELQGDDMGKVG